MSRDMIMSLSSASSTRDGAPEIPVVCAYLTPHHLVCLFGKRNGRFEDGMISSQEITKKALVIFYSAFASGIVLDVGFG